jgi:hypothetical protein
MDALIKQCMTYLDGSRMLGRKHFQKTAEWLMSTQNGVDEDTAKRAVRLAAQRLCIYAQNLKSAYHIDYTGMLRPGDHITGGRVVENRYHTVEGFIARIVGGTAIDLVDGDWCGVESVWKVRWIIERYNDLATERQKDAIRNLHEANDPYDCLFVFDGMTNGDFHAILNQWMKVSQYG